MLKFANKEHFSTFLMITSLKRNVPLLAFALFFMSSVAQAATWFVLEAPESVGGIKVEVDLESLRSRGEKRDVMTRITYPQPQKKQDIRFQSVIAEIEISCSSNLDIWKSVSFFPSGSAEGKPLSSENFGTAGLPRNVLKMLPDNAWTTLQRSACGRTTTVAP
jgi:hypothetical protein